MRLAGRIAAAAAIALALVLAAGPRNTAQADQPPLPRPPLPATLEAVPAWVAAREAVHADIVPGAEARFSAGPAGPARAPWAVVYLHGFSATRQETAPLTESIAAQLGAHHFAARLTGHGRGGPALGEASVAAWKADALEALAIGRLAGERVLVVGVSTGATLAVWLAQQPEARDGTAWVLISPNFGPHERSAEIVNWPWGRQLARWIAGPERSFEPRHPDQARYWTTRYPTEALFPMMATVHLARQQALEQWQAPVLMALAPGDQVIDVDAARRAYARMASPHKTLLEVTDAGDLNQHVIAGRILSPGNTEALAMRIAAWVKALPAGR